LDRLVESNDAGFFEAVHTMSDFKIDIAISGDGDVVTLFIPYFLGDDRAMDADVLEVSHRGPGVEILDVKAKVTGAIGGIRNGAADVDFGVKHGYAAGELALQGVVKFVTASCHAYTMCFCLLRADVADEVGVGDFAVLGNL
jgi:hypothetical protein